MAHMPAFFVLIDNNKSFRASFFFQKTAFLVKLFEKSFTKNVLMMCRMP